MVQKSGCWMLGGVLVAFGCQAQSVNTTADLSVTANVVATCVIGNGTLAFGVYDQLGVNPTDGDSASSVTVRCTNFVNYDIYSTTPAVDRKMLTAGGGAGKELTYKLYASSANRTSGIELPISKTTGAISGTGTGSDQYVTIYGRIAAGQNVQLGSYSGVANLTIDY